MLMLNAVSGSEAKLLAGVLASSFLISSAVCQSTAPGAAGGTSGISLGTDTSCTIVVRFKPLAPVPPTARSATILAKRSDQ